MKIYLVGGAVRDQILERSIQEKDWVVVGATVAEMLQQGFRQVGKDFPVFLHPKTKEEYALARKERKVGPGYTGFVFDTSPDVTLEEDLSRRDLTINAMAQTAEGQLIDPFHGKEDCERGILRHVSPAFIEDPVRVLRTARFSARFGFNIADETIALMRKMAHIGELDALQPERVWKEFQRALLEPHPDRFFETLAKTDALQRLFPQISLNGKGMSALLKLVPRSNDPEARFAILFHDVALVEIDHFCDTYRVPQRYRDLASLVAKEYARYHMIKKLNAAKILDVLLACDAFRRPERFNQFLCVCDVISDSSFSSHWENYLVAAKQIDLNQIDPSAKGPAIANYVKEERIKAIRAKLSQT